MSSAMSNAVFDVVVDGTEVGKAASARGLKPRSLSITVMRIKQRMDDLSNAAYVVCFQFKCIPCTYTRPLWRHIEEM